MSDESPGPTESLRSGAGFSGETPVPNPGRSGFLTVRDRRQLLDKLPSIQRSPVLADDVPPDAVDEDSPPPPQPPPPEPPPIAEAHMDWGSPIPDHYAMDRVTALARDPHWLFVYWELMGGRLERLRFKYSREIVENARWVLKVQATPHLQTEFVDIDPHAASWYIKVTPNTRYLVELGFFTSEGRYEAVCRSREILTPRQGISPVVDEHWMVRSEDLRRLLLAGGAWPELKATPGSSDRNVSISRAEHPRAAAFFSGRLLDRRELEELQEGRNAPE